MRCSEDPMLNKSRKELEKLIKKLVKEIEA